MTRLHARIETIKELGNRLWHRTSLVLAILLLAISPEAQSQPIDEDDKAHFELTPYLVLGGMSGDVTLQGRTADVSASAGDVLSNLQFGFMGRMRVTYNRWFAAFDGTYMGLGAANDLVDAGVDQTIIEPSVGYRVLPMLEVLGGVRYNNIAAELNFRGPAGVRLDASQNWWDPFVGGRVIVPLGQRVSVSARLDIGGFSAGSRIAVNSEPLLNVKISSKATLIAGWKFLYTDYRNNDRQFRYNVLSQGPMFGATFRW